MKFIVENKQQGRRGINIARMSFTVNKQNLFHWQPAQQDTCAWLV